MTDDIAPPLSNGAFAKSLHVAPRLGLVYVNNPKVACSSIKLTLQRAELDDPAYTPDRSVHDHQGSPLLTWPEIEGHEAAALAQRFVFSFVRNPYERLRSAYLNKIVRPQKQGRPRQHAGFSPGICPGFSEFVLSVCGDPHHRRNPHWRPQVENLSVGVIGYDFIGRLEDFTTDWARLAALTGLPDRPAFAGKRTDSKAKAQLIFTPAMAAAVQQAYGRDFQHFGYNPELSRHSAHK